MSDQVQTATDDLINPTMQIVVAYLENNVIPATELRGLIADVHAGLAGALSPAHTEAKAPAVAISKSVAADHITCLEDGQQFKTIRRHLRVAHAMTPEQYRAKWGLPSDYPMVAANYSTKRSRLAKASGLGSRAGRPGRRRGTSGRA